MGSDSGNNEDSPAAAAAKKADEQEGGGGKKASAGGLKKGPWTAAEDEILVEYVRKNGEGNWNRVQRSTGLARCGKSCRLRWANHLRPNLKKGSFTPEEELLILRLHAQLGNKWARMASQLPGRTDNEIKNYWNTRIKRRQRAGLPLYPPEVQKPSMLSSMPPLGFPPGKPKFTARRPPPLLNTMTFGAPPGAGMAAASPFARGPYAGQLSFPFSPVAPPPTPTSLFQQQQQPPLPQMVFGMGNYDASLQHLSSPLPAKMELPSSQFLYPDPLVSGTIPGGRPGDMLLQDVSGGTAVEEFKFCDLFSDAVPTLVDKDTDWSYIGGGGTDDLYHREESGGGIEASLLNSVLESAFKTEFLDSDFGEGINTKCEPADIPDNLAHGDLSTLYSIPAPIMPEIPECSNINNAEHISNDQSSVLNVDYLGLEMDQLASSLSIPPMDHDQEWNIGSCSWNNMPGIC